MTPATCSETSKATSAIFAGGGGVWDAKPAVPGQFELLLVPAVHVQQHVKGKGQEGERKEGNGTKISGKRRKGKKQHQQSQSREDLGVPNFSFAFSKHVKYPAQEDVSEMLLSVD